MTDDVAPFSWEQITDENWDPAAEAAADRMAIMVLRSSAGVIDAIGRNAVQEVTYVLTLARIHEHEILAVYLDYSASSEEHAEIRVVWQSLPLTDEQITYYEAKALEEEQ